MTATLETLELTPEELNLSKEAVQKIAYFNWLDVGCPEGKELECWLKAEREWIGHNYVPHRALDGECQQRSDQSATTTADETRQNSGPSVSHPQRRARAKA